MAYDLMVSKSLRNDESPKQLGALDYSDYSTSQRLAERTNSNFLNRLLDPSKDEMFDAQDLIQAQNQLHELMITDLDTDARDLTYKLLAIIGFAIRRGKNYAARQIRVERRMIA
jgi:hypothetical protein